MSLNVLVLCTGNSARSLIGEALFNHLGKGRVHAFSAGSRPAGRPDPMALEVLEAHGVSTDGLGSKGWNRFADGPELDLVVTVCDSAASEACPVWPGAPATAHWGLPDPAAVEDEAERRRAFAATYATLAHRVGRLLALDLDGLPPDQLAARARAVATEPGTTV
jgi:arsenate reductase (thioredoxin)